MARAPGARGAFGDSRADEEWTEWLGDGAESASARPAPSDGLAYGAVGASARDRAAGAGAEADALRAVSGELREFSPDNRAARAARRWRRAVGLAVASVATLVVAGAATFELEVGLTPDSAGSAAGRAARAAAARARARGRERRGDEGAARRGRRGRGGRDRGVRRKARVNIQVLRDVRTSRCWLDVNTTSKERWRRRWARGA